MRNLRLFVLISTVALFIGSMSLLIQARAVTADSQFELQYNPVDTYEYLVEFHEDPKRVMNSRLAKLDTDGALIPDVSPALFPHAISATEILKAKDDIRTRLCRAAGVDCSLSRKMKTFATVDEANQVTKFLFTSSYLTNLLEMENLGLQEVLLEELPWSGSFWPTRKGLVGRRWMDPMFPDSSNWIDNFNYVSLVPSWALGSDIMAPSEKYDLLVGDSELRLTQESWNLGRYHHERGNPVPAWAGLCHGWAPASFMVPNPKNAVTVMSPSGHPITFYPSDLKALASLAWGEAPPRFKFVGSRCVKKSPQEDEVGRVVDGECFDVNPATWHMGIVNQLGREKRSFVFDATYDFQVWNYPVAGYSYHYFNPQTLAVSKKLAGSMVSIHKYSIDKFKPYRSPQAQYVVGIAMTVTYSGPTQPSQRSFEKPSLHTVKYVYDLELDAKGNVIGGEWYSNFHPDFIWNIPVDGRAVSVGEADLDPSIGWDGAGPVPSEIRALAPKSSGELQPLYVVIERLLELSQ